MRSYDPTDSSDVESAERLGAEPWMLAQLDLNPGYCRWGPYEDYMWKKGPDEGGRAVWDARLIIEDWDGFEFELNEYNEVVNFYFVISREQEECSTCAGTGTHPDAQWVSNSFYEHSSPFNANHKAGSYPDEATFDKYGPDFRAFCEQMRDGDVYWSNKITQDEADALQAAGRLRRMSGATFDREVCEWVGGRKLTADEVNAAQNGSLFGHDSINHLVLTEARCKRLGLPKTCPDCDGHGTIYTAPKPTLGLVLWVLYPRKGCSRGMHIKHIREDQLPAVYAFLRQAADRNAERFSKVPVSDPAVSA